MLLVEDTQSPDAEKYFITSEYHQMNLIIWLGVGPEYPLL